MKRSYWIILIIAVALVIRVLFYINFPAYQTSGDSVTYYLTGQRMIRTHVFADQWRTPVYPIVIAGAYLLSGTPMTDTFPLLSYEFLAIRVIQSLAGIVTVLVVFFLLLRLGIGINASGIYCLFLACHRTLLVFEHQLLTESFSTLLIVSMVYFLVRLVERFDWMKFVIMTLLCIVGVFLRPSYVGIPFLVFGILIWFQKKRVAWIAGLVGLVLYISILSLYAETNSRHFQYRGISRISDVNLLGKVLTLNLPIENTKDIGGMKQIIQEYRSLYNDPNPWQVFVRFPQLYETVYSNALGGFVRAVIGNTAAQFLLASTLQIPGALISVSDENDILQTTGRFEWLFVFLDNFYHTLQYVLIVLFIAGPVFIYRAIGRKNVKYAGFLILSVVSLYHILFAVYLGYADYTRHISVAYPLMYILVFVFLYDIWKRLKKVSV